MAATSPHRWRVFVPMTPPLPAALGRDGAEHRLHPLIQLERNPFAFTRYHARYRSLQATRHTEPNPEPPLPETRRRWHPPDQLDNARRRLHDNRDRYEVSPVISPPGPRTTLSHH
jgi:hypothetical protein